ncbi:MAG: NAD(P)H-dependent oxidoreductase [Lachnospiraceae bacterium]|nr:NAD(P)H-dependent oxidoreductase [Lachnospiraceae bacterium]
MKAAVVYYSFEGNTEYVARRIAEKTGAEQVRLLPGSEPPRSGPGKFLVGGFRASTGSRPALKPIAKNMDDYDVIILGCPVWAGTYPPAVGTFLQDYRFRGKDVYLFGCSMSGNAGKMFEKLTKALDGNHVAGTLSLISPRSEKDKADPMVDGFCTQILRGAGDVK